MHQARHLLRRIGVAVVVHALDERGGTVADADDAYADVAHLSSFSSITCCRSCGRFGIGLFPVDQFVEPAHLPVRRLQAVFLQLERVAVQPLARAGERAANAVPPLLYSPTAAFEDLQPHVGPGLREERESSSEPLVVVGVGADVGEEFGQSFLALGGELIHPLASPRPAAGCQVRSLLGDPSCFGQPSQRRI